VTKDIAHLNKYREEINVTKTRDNIPYAGSSFQSVSECFLKSGSIINTAPSRATVSDMLALGPGPQFFHAGIMRKIWFLYRLFYSLSTAPKRKSRPGNLVTRWQARLKKNRTT